MKLSQIAMANQFGQEVEQFRPSMILWIILAIASLIAGSILVAGIPIGWGWVVRVPFLGVLLLLLSPCFLVAMLWSMPMRLALYERGLIYKNWKLTKVIRYDEIQAVDWQKPMESPEQAAQNEYESFVLQLANGDRFEVPVILDNLDKLYSFLQNRRWS